MLSKICQQLTLILNQSLQLSYSKGKDLINYLTSISHLNPTNWLFVSLLCINNFLYYKTGWSSSIADKSDLSYILKEIIFWIKSKVIRRQFQKIKSSIKIVSFFFSMTFIFAIFREHLNKMHVFFIINTFISNTRLKLAKN